jgi:hypothetical protein
MRLGYYLWPPVAWTNEKVKANMKSNMFTDKECPAISECARYKW